jgi:redox-sensitive bicupin YhaK (pirin superfamily)
MNSGRGTTTVFSAGAGDKHAELNIDSENMHAFYLWVLRDHRLLPPSMSTIGASPDSRLRVYGRDKPN